MRCLNGVLTPAAAHQTCSPLPLPLPVLTLGGSEAAGSIYKGAGVALNTAGTLFVVDSGNDRIQKYDTSGNYLGQIGLSGTSAGQFKSPAAIAVDPSDNLYVIDSGNHRVQKFDANGAFLLAFGGVGTRPGQLLLTTALFDGVGIAIDTNGNVLVTDSGNYRVQTFDSNGRFLSSFGSQGSMNGQFQKVTGVAVQHTSGTIFVSDAGNHRVQAFNSAGNYLFQFNEGRGGATLLSPGAIGIDRQGRVWVSDAGRGTLEGYSLTGAHSISLDADPGYNGLRWGAITGMAFDATGNIFLSDTLKSHVIKLDSSFVMQRFGRGFADGQFDHPTGLAVSPSGDVYVVDDDNYRIQVFRSTGQYSHAFGGWGSGNGQWGQATGIAVGSLGLIYVSTIIPGNTCVAGSPYSRIQVFDAAGVYRSTLASMDCGSEDVWYSDVAVDTQGNVYSSTGRDEILKFSPAGALLLRFAGHGSDVGKLDGVGGMVVDGHGNIYVSEYRNLRVSKFSPAGQVLMLLGGGRDGVFITNAQGVGVDLAGNVYVGQATNVLKFNAAGSLLSRVGRTGYHAGEFNLIRGVAVDGQGNVFAVDRANSTVQKFAAF